MSDLTCVYCKNFNLKEVPAMAKYGFCWCPHQNMKFPNGTISRAATVSSKREICDKFTPADALAVSNRIEWIERAMK